MTTRIITGIASTPTLDSQGHKMVVKNLNFVHPMPLYLEHLKGRAGNPVGDVLSVWPDGDVLKFRAKVTDGKVWQRIAAGELRGASISFKDSKGEHDDAGALLVTGGTVTEISVTTSPANPDCIIQVEKPEPVFYAASKAQAPASARRKRTDWLPLDGKTARDRDAAPRIKKLQDACRKVGLKAHDEVTLDLFTRTIGYLHADLANIGSWVRSFDKRINEIADTHQHFAGVHQRALAYRRGALVTFKGGLWAAVVDAPEGTIPGSDPCWQLAVKPGEAQ